MSETGRRHLFISHHHKDDEHVTKMTQMLSRAGYDIRNSSIRAKPANQERIDKGLVSDRVIERLLRMKISWASTVVVLIGTETHSREWVDWEIRQAHLQGKRTVGVYAPGVTQAQVPPALDEYGADIVDWNADRIMSAIDGTRTGPFLGPDGRARAATAAPTSTEC